MVEATFKIGELVLTIFCSIIATLSIGRGFQIIKRHDSRRYGRAIIFIIFGMIISGIGLSIIYFIGFGLA